MLVLTRKQQQQIQIGQNILVTIVRVKGNTVRIGIEAPQSVRIARPEAELEAAPNALAEAVADAVEVAVSAAGPIFLNLDELPCIQENLNGASWSFLIYRHGVTPFVPPLRAALVAGRISASLIPCSVRCP